jgi:hypothetical protein
MPGDPSVLDGWVEARNNTRNNVIYSFDLGMVHMIMISTEHDLSASSVQVAWLQSHLPAIDRSKTPFVFVGMHRPIYSSTTDASKAPETADMRTVLEPLFVAHRVTAVVAGHMHQYERSCALADGQCVDPVSANGTVYLTAGIAGVSHNSPWVEPTPPWVVKQDNHTHGYARFDVINSTHIRGTAVDCEDDAEFDRFYLRA